jgi:dihydrofolate synthase / folylpolyglutamate synthase
MQFSQAVEALDARTNYERSGRLVAPTRERIEALLELLDHPEQNFPVIHITGTNGKSTTARAATEVLRAAGLRVATYTSPHVSSVRERFAYDGAPISEEEFVDAWRELDPYLKHFDEQGMITTWFEAATALAFVWFADKAVDAAVLEVGMGGAWDATNVVDARVSVITGVGMDHRELGATPAEVAREKSMIIKPKAIALSANQEPEVWRVLEARCEEVDAILRKEGEAFGLDSSALALGGQSLSLHLSGERYDDVFLPMFGQHFARDAVIGAAAARALIGDHTLPFDVVAAGLANTKVPGRMEIARRHPLVVLDGAHNAPAAEALAAAFPTAFALEDLRLVVSIMDDKDVRGVLAPLIALAREVIVTRNESPRAASIERMVHEVRDLGVEPIIVPNVADAVKEAIRASQTSDGVLVTGSLYTVGEARASLAGTATEAHPKETS